MNFIWKQSASSHFSTRAWWLRISLYAVLNLSPHSYEFGLCTGPLMRLRTTSQVTGAGPHVNNSMFVNYQLPAPVRTVKTVTGRHCFPEAGYPGNKSGNFSPTTIILVRSADISSVSSPSLLQIIRTVLATRLYRIWLSRAAVRRKKISNSCCPKTYGRLQYVLTGLLFNTVWLIR